MNSRPRSPEPRALPTAPHPVKPSRFIYILPQNIRRVIIISMNKRTGIIIAVIILIFAGFLGISIWQGRSAENPSSSAIVVPSLSEIEEISLENNYDGYNLNSIIPANGFSGNLPENIKGDADKAKVILYEYADYQCEHCAAMNPCLNQILEEYGDKVALVFRTYIMPYHNNGVITAAAANAAAIQGYWPEMKDVLFANQNEWYYAKASEMPEYLDRYFEAATNGKGDLEKFHQDMQSEAVKHKIAFDMGLSEKADLQWTPSVYVGDKFMNQKEIGGTYDEFLQAIRNEIDKQLNN